MGTWGTAISSNDTFEDIRGEFFEMYNEGFEPAEVSKNLINSNQEIIDDEEESNNFWFALALCQWECKSLERELLERVTQIISSGKDIALWKELGAEKSDLSARQKTLEKFLEKLNSEKKNPKRRKKKKFRDSIFKKGDCLSIRLSSGSFGAAFVLESEEQTEYGFNLIAICDYIGSEPPTLELFKNANVLISKQQALRDAYEDYPLISWYMAEHFKASESNLKIVGSLETTKKFSSESDYRSFVHWKFISHHIESQPQLVTKHGQPKMTIKLKELRN
jgi:hypothetical protein